MGLKDVKAQIGNVVTITDVKGKQKSGVLALSEDNSTLKLSRPGGGRGRPFLVKMDDIHTFVVNGPAPLVVSAPEKPRQSDKPKMSKPVVAEKVSWQEAKERAVASVQGLSDEEELDDEVEVDDESDLSALKITLPTRQRRCPYSGVVVTRENGFRISFHEDEDGELVEKVFFFDKNVPEIARMIEALRTDREPRPITADEEEEIDDEK